MPHLSRRRFLWDSAALGTLAMAGCAPLKNREVKPAAGPRVRGANERIRVAIAGINGRGKAHIKAFTGMEGVEVVCLVDPDSRLFEDRTESVEEKTGRRPRCVQDIRKVLDDKTIDVVSIATPNHWHSLMTIWACQAGKDVYVEKPMSHNVFEGRKAVEAARRYGRIVQHGTQSRTWGEWHRIMAAIHSGKLGKLKISRGLCYKAGDGGRTRGSVGFKPHKQPPPELDFDLWLGPAPKQPYHENLVHYCWHWFWDFGNGDLGNQGVHQMDIARWGIKGATLPRSVVSFGGRLGYFDQGEVASTQMAIMDFGETKLIFETRGLPSKPYGGRGSGTENVFHLEGGTIIGTTFYDQTGQKAPLPQVDILPAPGGDHFSNFIAAVRSRRQSDLNADILEGHYSSACCHLCNMSIRTGGKVPFRPRPEELTKDPDVLDVLERTEQHLAENGVDLDRSGYILGRELIVDAEKETTQDPQANLLLTRPYRKPFVVPEQV